MVAISGPSNTVDITPSFDRWWLKDLQFPSNNLQFDATTSLNILSKQDQGDFDLINRSDKITVYGKVRLPNFTLTVDSVGQDVSSGIRYLRTLNKQLLLQSPIYQWMMEFGSDVNEEFVNYETPYSLVTFEVKVVTSVYNNRQF